MGYRKALIAAIAVLLLCGVVCAQGNCPGGVCPMPGTRIGIDGDIGIQIQGRGFAPSARLDIQVPGFRMGLYGGGYVQPRAPRYAPRFYRYRSRYGRNYSSPFRYRYR